MQQSNRLKNHFDLANSRYTQLKNIDDIIASKFNDFNLRNYAEPGFTKVLNIGIGNGLELITLQKIYSEDHIKIIGIDISPTSIDLTKNLLIKHGIDPHQVELVNCNATKLPFPNQYVDIIFMNSLLHEVASYSKNWGKAWESAIHEAYRVLTSGGLLYIEDFTATNISCYIKITFKSELAKNFYTYFRNEYRSFKSWGEEGAKSFKKDRELVTKNLPLLKKSEDSILLGSALALELLTHFKIFNNDFKSGLVALGDKEWIEINERYYLSSDGIQNLTSTEQYAKKILNIVNRGNLSKGQLKCLKSDEIDRNNFLEDIQINFSANTENGEDFIKLSSKKMKLLFKKVI